MKTDNRTQGICNWVCSGLVWATVFSLFVATQAVAEERKFTVMMVVPPKSVNGGYPPPGVTSVEPQDIFAQYFDDFDPSIHSFNEYWREISYGEVTVAGDVFDWGEVPWPLLPNGGAQEITFDDLDGDFLLFNFVGEEFDQSKQQFMIDYNGSYNNDNSTGTEDDPYSGAEEDPPGLEDYDTNGIEVWTPGERFLDMDNDGRYDALIESTADGYGQRVGSGENVTCEFDGLINGDEFCDENENEQWDFPEPFEDFLLVYYPEAESSDGPWVRLDPSENNTDDGDAESVGSRAWAIAYIKRNYPGDADALIARCGNGKYDGPDSWVDRGNSKLQRSNDLDILFPLPLTTPPPGSGYGNSIVSYGRWWRDYWRDSHYAVGVRPVPAPDAPEWPINIPDMQPFNPTSPNQTNNDRYRPFRPNAGGTNARRGGEECDPDPTDTNDVDGDPLMPECHVPVTDEESVGNGDIVDGNDGIGNSNIIRPDEDGYYDGPAEFQDLPSSIYHTRSFWIDPPSYSGFVGQPFLDTNGAPDATTIGFRGEWYGGDGRFGEVTSPFASTPWGHDRGPNNPGSGETNLDNTVPPAGPFAYNIHGTSGYDGGNVLTLEFLTWRKDDDATSGVAMKRDYNLDGLLDQGEVRDVGTENYARDADPATPGDGSPSEAYPFNRRRLTEDAVEVHDGVADWDNLIMSTKQSVVVTNGFEVEVGVNFVHSTFVLPAGIIAPGLAPGGRGLFQLPAPGMDLPIQVVEEDLGSLSPIYFSDFGTALGDVGETGGSVNDFSKTLMAHEWLHVWERYPDLYDYDVYLDGQGIVDIPVGGWDIMAGGLVHPSPVLKEKFVGQGGPLETGIPLAVGTAHAPWIEVTDLTDVLEPLIPTVIEIPDFALEPTNSVFYYQNRGNNADPQLEERFYFWRLTDNDPMDLGGVGGNVINFSRNAPGEGLLIMHVNLPDDNLNSAESQPLVQRVGSNPVYGIVQADNGSDAGDSGDPFPGTSPGPDGFGVREWLEAGTTPDSTWYSGDASGISILDIFETDESSFVLFFWNPRLVPSLNFSTSQLGQVVGSNYRLRYEAFDYDGGTTIEFYFDTDNSGFDGTLLTPTQSKGPGLINGTYNVPLISLPGDGTYFFYARLVPGPGQDGRTDPVSSPGKPAGSNKGRGEIVGQSGPIDVDISTSKFERWTLLCIDHTNPGAEIWAVFGDASGFQNPATTGVPYTSDENEVSFTINWTGIVGSTGDVSNLNGQFKLTDASANFDASDFDANDVVRITGGTNAVTGFYKIISVPNSTELILASNPGNSNNAGNVSYRIHSFSSTNDNLNTPDEFTFFTTGKSSYSPPVTFQNGNVIPKMFPEFTVTYPTPTNPLHVRFDASQTRDEFFALGNPDLEFTWDFGDGEVVEDAGEIVEHTYAQGFPLGANVLLTVLNSNPNSGLMETIGKNITVGPRDDDLDGIPTDSDNCPEIPNADQINNDGDPAGDACDGCPFDSSKLAPDVCPCGEVPVDSQCTDNCVCIPDCNTNGIADTIDIGTVSEDCDGNNIPDECQSQADCDDNGELDICAIAAGSEDCNVNSIPDECESQDNCNNNGVLDICELAGNDCNNNLILDECEPDDDCNNNQIQDICEIDGNDCNANDVLDECDIALGSSPDVDNTDIPDECEDCNDNQILDTDDIANCPTGFANAAECADCNNDRIPDGCQGDSDNDGTFDPCDGCPNDFLKIAPGTCGCGTPETDTDNDGTPNCNDGCPTDPAKTSPGSCNCGIPETDSDGDGVPNCIDVCTNGTGDEADDRIDTDNDGTPDCVDDCPDDANETEAGACGCGVEEEDPDFDGIPDCNDNCPLNANANQTDSDGDGRGNACDACPNDANKTAVGVCGCGSADSDSDGDGDLDCVDNCPDTSNGNQLDSDGDGAGDACDDCPNDASKAAAGVCGCGVAETDSDVDGVPNCNDLCQGTPPGTAVDDEGCAIPLPQTSLPGADCESTADCVEGEVCVDTVCQVSTNGCETSQDCPQGETCVDGECTTDDAACTANADCPTGQNCVNGECVDTDTTDNADCGADVPCGGTGTAAMLMMLLGFSRMKARRPRHRRQR
ncbi:MAG: hypothetical protein DHS20C16_28780 [Phycisphaerae bacterium]|nr:MAG: hypothetical protein DHS20C16_28780 [Phycisphaerae bacterium]